MRRSDAVILTDGKKILETLEAPSRQIYTDDTMKVVHVNDNSKSADLFMYYCGSSLCEKGHTFGPAIREHFVIHYIINGEGTLYINKTEYHLHKGQGFLLCPGVVSKYQASMTDPWEYVWVGFHGLNAASYLNSAGLSESNPVFTYDSDDRVLRCMEDMVRTNDSFNLGADLRLQSLLYQLLADLVDNNSSTTKEKSASNQYHYVRKALECIQMNYMNDLNVNSLAEELNLNRSYLSTIFKKVLNTSPQSYLSQYRINKACELLSDNDYPILDIALMVGFKDYATFQRSFKKIMDMSPGDYRKNLSR
ncbi:MAG: AraC family transcriptional regulator [Pseudobutyrivibrio sp.]|nr:AraC family transcriptional regulator [Pseudobutyrivibrio sp.]